MKNLISALLSLSVLLMSAVGYAEEIKTEIELPKDVPTGAYTGNEIICIGSVEAPISLFSQTPQESCYDYIYDILYKCDTSYYDGSYMVIPVYTKGYYLTIEEFNNMFECFTTERGELLLGILAEYSYVEVSTGEKYIYDLYFTYAKGILNSNGVADSSIITNMRSAIDSVVNPFINSLDSSLSDLEKVLLTHDFIASNAIYLGDRSLINETYYHSLHSAIVGGETVCQGYTLAMCYILNKLGVDCVACISNEVEHVWNCVKVDGKWYHVDLTWDDAFVGYDDSKNIIGYIEYSNFMLSYESTFGLKNNEYLKNYKKEDMPDSVSFKYPSQSVTNDLTNNKEFESGYMFVSVKNVAFDNTDDDGTEYEEHFYPIGFTYSNGKLVHKISTTGRNIFEKEYSFIYDSLFKTDYGVSVPIKKSSNEYVFLFEAQNKEITLGNEFSGYIKTVDANNSFGVHSFKTYCYQSVEPYYGMVYINDSALINQIDNAKETEFFFWDGNMRPLTQKTAYQNQ